MDAQTLGKKGVSGKVLTIIMSLVIAFMALILLWAFLTGGMPLVTQLIENMVTGLKKMICEKTRIPRICEWALNK